MPLSELVNLLGEPRRGRETWAPELKDRVWWAVPTSYFAYNRFLFGTLNRDGTVRFDPVPCLPLLAGPPTDSSDARSALRICKESLTNFDFAWSRGTPIVGVTYIAFSIGFSNLVSHCLAHPSDGAFRSELVALARRHATRKGAYEDIPIPWSQVAGSRAKGGTDFQRFMEDRYTSARAAWAWNILFQLGELRDGVSLSAAVTFLGEPNRSDPGWGEELANRVWWEIHRGLPPLFGTLFDGEKLSFDDRWPKPNISKPPPDERTACMTKLRLFREQLANQTFAVAVGFPDNSVADYVLLHPNEQKVRDELVRLALRYASVDSSKESRDANHAHHDRRRIAWCWHTLFKLAVLRDGMTREEACRILGTARVSQGRLVWYHKSPLHVELFCSAVERDRAVYFEQRNR
jgi:hypothetical protein